MSQDKIQYKSREPGGYIDFAIFGCVLVPIFIAIIFASLNYGWYYAGGAGSFLALIVFFVSAYRLKIMVDLQRQQLQELRLLRQELKAQSSSQ